MLLKETPEKKQCSWQDFNWLKGSRGLSAAAELLVRLRVAKNLTDALSQIFDQSRIT